MHCLLLLLFVALFAAQPCPSGAPTNWSVGFCCTPGPGCIAGGTGTGFCPRCDGASYPSAGACTATSSYCQADLVCCGGRACCAPTELCCNGQCCPASGYYCAGAPGVCWPLGVPTPAPTPSALAPSPCGAITCAPVGPTEPPTQHPTAPQAPVSFTQATPQPSSAAISSPPSGAPRLALPLVLLLSLLVCAVLGA